MRTPTPVTNKFQALAEEDGGLINAMNNFAHRLQIGKKKAQKFNRLKVSDQRIRPFGTRAVADCEADLDTEVMRDMIAALPKDAKSLNKLAKKCPDNNDLEADEMWVMADTGATVNALKVGRDCPKYVKHVHETAASRRGAGAECANGGFIKERGEVKIHVEIDGEQHVIPFKDMDVSMPIASKSARSSAATGW